MLKCAVLDYLEWQMIDYLSIIKKYYEPESDASRLLLEHSRQVADLAMRLILQNKLDVDKDFVYEGAMLHDIGMYLTHAPSIFCYGDKPYICHGYLGRELLDSIGMTRHALVCEHHTGAGLTCDEIVAQKLPLPLRDMLPTTTEEKLICYADKFFSKSHICPAKPLEFVRRQMSQYGDGTVHRFEELVNTFGSPDNL